MLHRIGSDCCYDYYGLTLIANVSMIRGAEVPKIWYGYPPGKEEIKPKTYKKWVDRPVNSVL